MMALFPISGSDKLTDYAGTAGYMEGAGVPGALLPLVVVTGVLGGFPEQAPAMVLAPTASPSPSTPAR